MFPHQHERESPRGRHSIQADFGDESVGIVVLRGIWSHTRLSVGLRGTSVACTTTPLKQCVSDVYDENRSADTKYRRNISSYQSW